MKSAHSLLMETGKTHLLILPGTKRSSIEVLHHPVEHSDEYEAVQEDGNTLSSEDRPRGHLRVMSHLLIRDIVIRLSDKVGPIRLHDNLSLWVTGENDTSEKLEKDTRVESYVGGGGHDCGRDKEDGIDGDEHDESPPGAVGRPAFECGDAERE